MQLCQLSEISTSLCPEFLQFYRHFPEKYPFLLNSSSQQQVSPSSKNIDQHLQSNFDILFVGPEYFLSMDNQYQLSISNPDITLETDELFLSAFDRIYARERKHQYGVFNLERPIEASQLPFRGGWFVFFAYELAQQIEPCLTLKNDEQGLPIAYAARVKQALIYDHQQDKIFFISEPGVEHDKLFKLIVKDIDAIQSALVTSNNNFAKYPSSLLEEDSNVFLHAVNSVREFIREGDVFQVNLSRLWQAEILSSEHAELAYVLANKLNKTNPAPYSGLASFALKGTCSTIISSSPERLLKVHNNIVESRPIAGTRPRSSSAIEDLRLLDELHAHPKEQAEHIMLIDLIRNDLGRVCIPGSVQVNELMGSESYAHVHHIVSNVLGQLRQDITPGQVIKALFPGGTITGCPKVRCMEIIAQLEQQSRSAYTGSMGYINHDGSMDLNILIRTMLLKQSEENNRQQQLSFRAGAGLVFDSIADNELQETRVKAKGLLAALKEAGLD